MKKCSKCKVEKDRSEFYKNKARYDGLCNFCKECDKKKPANKEKIRLRSKKYRESEKGKDWYKKYYQENKQKYKERNIKWYKENTDRYRELWRKYANSEKGKEYHKYQQAKRRAAKLNATLPGYDEEIKEIYKNCPKGYHVDHIYPLLGKKFRGLHVPWNLQYLSAEENFKKNNKSPEEWKNVKK